MTGSGRGKLILCGEHAVVYGWPALAFGTSLETRVTLRDRPGPTDVAAGCFRDARIVDALVAELGPDGVEVDVQSDIPVGRGMGSSAALAVALARAAAARRGDAPTDDAIDAAALRIERTFHGTPSGIDGAVAARGGLVAFRRTEAGPVIERLSPPPWSVVVLDSGCAGDTRVMVDGVRSRRPGVDDALARIGALVEDIRTVLPDVDAVGPRLVENHFLLREIGVSTPDLDALVSIALRSGASGAKLSGAGGGGVVIAVGRDPDRIVQGAMQHGIPAFVAVQGGALS